MRADRLPSNDAAVASTVSVAAAGDPSVKTHGFGSTPSKPGFCI
jgi:hypothetical protein